MTNVSLDDIGSDVVTANGLKTDSSARTEEELFKAEREAHLNGLVQDQSERKNYAAKIYWLIVGWLITLGGILLLVGFMGPYNEFVLSENVILALIGGTTANVLGLFIIVINYLFKK